MGERSQWLERSPLLQIFMTYRYHYLILYVDGRDGLLFDSCGGCLHSASWYLVSSFRLFGFLFQPHPTMAAKKTTGAASRPATRSSTSTSTSTSTGRSGTRAKPTPQAASKAKATPASKGRAKVATKAASSKGPGLTAEEEKLLKDLAEKKKKAAEEAAEAKKKGECPHFERLLLT